MLAGEIMIPLDFEPILNNTPMLQCLEIMKANHLTVLPVSDGKGLIGQVTLWKILDSINKSTTNANATDVSIQDIIDTDIQVVDVERSFDLTELKTSSILWVVQDGILKGVITNREIALICMEYLQYVLDYSFDYFALCDSKGYIKMASKSFQRLSGIPLSEFKNMNAFEMHEKGITDKSVSKLAIEKKRPVTVELSYSTNKKVICTASPIFNEEGDIKYIISNGRDISELIELKEELMKNQVLTGEYKKALLSLNKSYRNNDYVFHSKKMKRIHDLVLRIVDSEAPILICGESGVGKEVIVDLLYEYRNNNQPFIKINCAALSPQLIESELFGYVRGSYTGADKAGKAGLFEAANNGTIFLDEISEIPVHLQAKLLRAIQEKEIYRIGSTTPIKLNFRVIASTNKDLYKEVQEGRFRKDLLYRLMVIPINIPPLRERKEDIIPLVMHFLQKHGGVQRIIDTSVANFLMSYEWPGNVRELQNMVNYWNATIPTDVKIITMKYIPQNMLKTNVDIKNMNSDFVKIEDIKENTSLKDTIKVIEEKIILSTLEKCKNQKEAAQKLGLTESGLCRKLKKLKETI